VLRWGLWPNRVLVVIDHHSRLVTAVCPLEGPNAGWVVDALQESFRQHGPPRHIVTDQEGGFVSAAFAELLQRWNVRHRFGAVGKHDSIAVADGM
jgi:transposase InsO family protein